MFLEAVENEIFDSVIAMAILDRILHHSMTINIKGNSYRRREKVKARLSGETEIPIGFSGVTEGLVIFEPLQLL